MAYPCSRAKPHDALVTLATGGGVVFLTFIRHPSKNRRTCIVFAVKGIFTGGGERGRGRGTLFLCGRSKSDVSTLLYEKRRGEMWRFDEEGGERGGRNEELEPKREDAVPAHKKTESSSAGRRSKRGGPSNADEKVGRRPFTRPRKGGSHHFDS